jgi:hypothetical protein
MATTFNRTRQAGVSVETWSRFRLKFLRPKVHKPTGEFLGIVSNISVIVGIVTPRDHKAAFASIPLAWLLTMLARRVGLPRTPTILAFLAGTFPWVLIVFLGFQAIPANVAIARDRVIVAVSACIVLLIQEGMSRIFPHPDDKWTKSAGTGHPTPENR